MFRPLIRCIGCPVITATPEAVVDPGSVRFVSIYSVLVENREYSCSRFF